jgi:hypothetical protein
LLPQFSGCKSSDAASDIFSELVLKADRKTSDENDYVTVLGRLIRDYEEGSQALALPMTPQRALESLLANQD